MTRSPRQLMRRIQLIHFIGIGGAGMSGIAEVFQNLGYQVSGSDIRDSATVQHLQQLGIKVFLGHHGTQVEGCHVVVVSTAIDENNPEVKRARDLRIPVVRRAEMLAELMRFRQGIAIAGTHGKTTTTSLVASVLAEGGLDPTYVIGGKLLSSGVHAKLGDSDVLVAEADESDASFLYLKPVIAVVTNIDQDHLSTYEGDFERLQHTFLEFLHHLPFYGLAVVCIDDPVVRELLPRISRPVLTYGTSGDADVRISGIESQGARTHFSLNFPDSQVAEIELNLAGLHNVLNATAAAAVAWEMEIEQQLLSKALGEFAGIDRRFQIAEGVTLNGKSLRVIDDYGHHPNEISATVKAVKSAWPGEGLTVVFQPHRYTRTRDLFDDFSQVLNEVDRLILLEVYAAGEAPIKGADGRALSRAIRSRGRIEPVFVAELDELEAVLAGVVEDNDNLLMLGAGSIGAYSVRFIEQHQEGQG